MIAQRGYPTILKILTIDGLSPLGKTLSHGVNDFRVPLFTHDLLRWYSMLLRPFSMFIHNVICRSILLTPFYLLRISLLIITLHTHFRFSTPDSNLLLHFNCDAHSHSTSCCEFHYSFAAQIYILLYPLLNLTFLSIIWPLSSILKNLNLAFISA